MAGKAESLKEYLIKLGWDVDELGLNKVQKGVKNVEKSVESVGNKFVKSFAKASVSVGGFLAAATTGIFNFIQNVAQADIETEHMARQFWTTEENARSLGTALDVVGASYKDIWKMTPEEYKNLIELKNFSYSLKAPAELQKTLKQIRDINQEINKTKVIFNAATQWVAYYLGQFLGKDFKDAQTALKEFNNYLVEKLPIITEKVAEFLYHIVNIAKAVIWFARIGKEKFMDLFNSLPTGTKVGAAAITGFLAVLKMGPIGMFIAALTTLLLLLEDYYVWSQGGKSAFDWSKPFGGMFSGFDSSGIIGDLDSTKESVNALKDSLSDCKTAWGSVLDAALDFIEEHDVIDTVLSTLADTLNTIVNLLTGVANLLLLITGNFDKISDNSLWKSVGVDFKQGNIGSIFSDMFKGANKSLWDTGLFDWIPNAENIRASYKRMEEMGTLYNNQMTNRSQNQLVGGWSSSNVSTKNDNRRQTVNINVSVKSGGRSVANTTAQAVADALQDVDTLK